MLAILQCVSAWSQGTKLINAQAIIHTEAIRLHWSHGQFDLSREITHNKSHFKSFKPYLYYLCWLHILCSGIPLYFVCIFFETLYCTSKKKSCRQKQLCHWNWSELLSVNTMTHCLIHSLDRNKCFQGGSDALLSEIFQNCLHIRHFQ